MSRSIALGFVVYKVEGGFLSRIQCAIDLGYPVYILDNFPQQDMVRAFCQGKEDVHYFTSGKNVGLGLGISFVSAQAYYQGHSALLFFDQDSIFIEDTLKFISNYYFSFPELSVTHSVVAFDSSGNGLSQDCFKNVSLVINSGSLFYLDNLSKMNWHSENYFVDGVDYEFCLRSELNGFKIGHYSCTPGFDHTTEQADKKYRILNRTYAMRAYSVSRMLDATRSSWRLVISAALSRKFGFSANIARLWFIYVLVQGLVRVLDLFAKRGGKQ